MPCLVLLQPPDVPGERLRARARQDKNIYACARKDRVCTESMREHRHTDLGMQRQLQRQQPRRATQVNMMICQHHTHPNCFEHESAGISSVKDQLRARMSAERNR